MLVSIKQYADLCGAKSVDTIRKRIKNNLLKTTTKRLPDNSTAEYINTKKYPPAMLRTSGGGRKKMKKSTKRKYKN